MRTLQRIGQIEQKLGFDFAHWWATSDRDVRTLTDAELDAAIAEMDAQTIRKLGPEAGRKAIEDSRARIAAMSDEQLARARAGEPFDETTTGDFLI